VVKEGVQMLNSLIFDSPVGPLGLAEKGGLK
jgi:hypothetical protein